jgi:hypothetical protein
MLPVELVWAVAIRLAIAKKNRATATLLNR